MKASSLAWLAGGLTIAGAIGGGACTYNTYVIEPSSSSTGAGGGSASSASGASSTGSGAATSSSAGGGGASASSSSSSSSGMFNCDAGACDPDCDGDKTMVCGGMDCADDNPLVFTGQMTWFTVPIAGTMGYDYNCNNAEELQYSGVIACPDGLNGCDTKTEKWLKAPMPTCGMSAEYGVCVVDMLLGCKVKDLGARKQGCR